MAKLTREEWLNKMARIANVKLFKPNGYGLNMRKVRISCGYPPKGGLSFNKTVGVCFSDVVNGYNEIFIHPELSESKRVADVLVHELIHHKLNCEGGHGKPFRDIAVAIGLEGKMTATHAGKELNKKLKGFVKEVGKYPHKALKYDGGKKQGTRMLKVHCPECADYGTQYIVRMSRTTIENYGTPTCPFEHQMELA